MDLSDKDVKMERTFYSIFNLVSDIGGFNGAIIIFPSFVMSYYNASAYTRDITRQIPVRYTKRKARRRTSKYSMD